MLTENIEKYEVAPIAISLMESFRSITLSFGTLKPILKTLQMSQNFIQAVPPGSSPLLQLPYFTQKVVKAVQGDTKYHMTVQQYMELPEARRRKLSVGQDLLSDKQYQSAISVASQIPALHVCKAFFKVVGEKVITPSSLVQLVVKARFVPPGSVNVPNVKESDLEDIDPEEDDIDAIIGKSKLRNEQKKETVQPPLAHAPYYARDHSPRWQIFLADTKSNRLAVPPFTFSTFDKPIFDADGKPTFNVQTLKMQFQAPPQVAKYPFSLFVVCDSYMGFDTTIPIVLQVDDFAKAAALDEEDEISEPDEGMYSSYHLLPKKRFIC